MRVLKLAEAERGVITNEAHEGRGLNESVKAANRVFIYGERCVFSMALVKNGSV